jgi:hypothetical protein
MYTAQIDLQCIRRLAELRYVGAGMTETHLGNKTGKEIP